MVTQTILHSKKEEKREQILVKQVGHAKIYHILTSSEKERYTIAYLRDRRVVLKDWLISAPGRKYL